MLHAIILGHGASWDDSRLLREQDGWNAHAGFMDALVDDGFVVAGGPLGPDRPTGALLVVDAEDEIAIRDRLSADPWIPMGLLTVESIERWTILLGDPAALLE
jgi:hypothetical protein